MEVTHQRLNLLLTVSILAILPMVVFRECTCDPEAGNVDKSKALKYRIGSIFSILVGGAIGVCIPLLGKSISVLRPERDLFFIIKAFAAGVILATGFICEYKLGTSAEVMGPALKETSTEANIIHVLPEAFEGLTSSCLSANPWANFPFTGFVAMMSSIGTLLIDAFAMSYFSSKVPSVKPHGGGSIDDGAAATGEDWPADHEQITIHSHSHAHGFSESCQLLRHRVISQVLELGIVVHSVIIGIALGASQDPSTIRPLLAALTFHQFFEGMGLGGTIAQAKFKIQAIITMAMFFSLTTPVGIAIGIGISNVYDENSPTALIVQGIFDSASAGILIYMALVDLLAADFMSAKWQKSVGLQLTSTVSLLFGVGCMSLLAKWA